MLRLIRFVLFGDAHLHVWDTVEKGVRATADGYRTGNFYDCRCRVCGRYRAFNT